MGQHQAHIVYEKFNKGKPLTDSEVRFGRIYYYELERKLIECGPVFHLAWIEAARVARAFDDFFKARKLQDG